MSILIIDDNNTQNPLLQSLLQQGGFSDVKVVTTLAQALAILDTPQHSIDLLILRAITMPQQAIEACKRIRARYCYHTLPIMVIAQQHNILEPHLIIEAGATDYLYEPINPKDFIAKIKATLQLKDYMDGLEKQKQLLALQNASLKKREKELLKINRELHKSNKQLHSITHIDSLTGLANRRYFDESLKREWRHARRYSEWLSLILLDIDSFKLYNDSYGHQKGDKVLLDIASSIRYSLKRASDCIARYGGEEFAVILPSTNQESAKELAEDCRKQIEALAIEHKNSPVTPYVSVSLGVTSTIPNEHNSSEALVAAADRALYKVKAAGGNGVIVYQEPWPQGLS